MKNRKIFADTCQVHCTDKDQTLDVEILDFVDERFLHVAVQRSIKLKLSYVEKHGQYVGSMSGLEFTSDGPDLLN